MKNTVNAAVRAAAFAAVLLALVGGRLAMGDNNEYSRPSLKGISGVHVLVESFDEEAKSAGFNRQTFQAEVELKLRSAGIKALTEEEWVVAPGLPWLYLNVNPLHDQRGEHAAYSINLEFNQNVSLTRSPSTEFSATTWSIAGVRYDDLPHIREQVKDSVDTFINAWLSVNPR